MFKRISEKVYLPVIFFLLIQPFVSSEFFWALGLAFCLYIIIIKDHFRITIPFKSYLVLILFLLWGMAMGVWLYVDNQIELRDYLKDIYYYSTSLIYIYIGSYYARQKINLCKLLNGFIVSAALLSIVYFVQLLSQGMRYLLASDVYGWRSVTGGGAIVIGVSLAIILADIIPKDKALNKPLLITCLIITGIFFVVSLSRTNLMILLLMTTILALRKDNVKAVIGRTLGILILALGAVWLMSIILPSGLIKTYVEKIFGSLTEVSTSNVWTATSIQQNWRGYENYSAINLWKQSAVFNQVFGFGFGKRIYVGTYAYTLLGQLMGDGSAADSISVLHNGYATQLIKLGMLGVILYIVFYLSLIKEAIKGIKVIRSAEARILLAVGFALLVQTYFLNGLFKDYCFYPFVILIGFTGYSVSRNHNLTEF